MEELETQEETSNLKADLAEADARIDELKEAIRIGEATERLIVSDDYAAVFVDGFYDGERDRIAGVLTTPNYFDDGQLNIFMEKMAAIRHTKEWIKACMINYTTALEQLPASEDYRNVITARYANDAIDTEEA